MTRVEKTVFKNIAALVFIVLGAIAILKSVQLFLAAKGMIFPTIYSLRPGIIGFISILLGVVMKEFITFKK